MRTYTHKNHPELEAEIQYVWHKDFRDDNYTLMFNREVIIVNVKDEEIESNPFWILTYDTEQGGEIKG